MIGDDYWNLWNMPNCIGSIDGDAKYRFMYVDVGAYGSQSDGGIFQNISFGEKLFNSELDIPIPKELPGTQITVPHYIVTDAAFPLGKNLMRAYPDVLLPKETEIFNKRLSRARRTIENSFGILSCRWRILLTTIDMMQENVEKIMLRCVLLHNFIMLNKIGSQSYCPSNYIDWEDSESNLHGGLWRQEISSNLPSIVPSAKSQHYG